MYSAEHCSLLSSVQCWAVYSAEIVKCCAAVYTTEQQCTLVRSSVHWWAVMTSRQIVVYNWFSVDTCQWRVENRWWTGCGGCRLGPMFPPLCQGADDTNHVSVLGNFLYIVWPKMSYNNSPILQWKLSESVQYNSGNRWTNVQVNFEKNIRN